jgi:hypothetical protein
MLYIKRAGLDVPLFVERYFYLLTFKCMDPIGWGCGKTLGGNREIFLDLLDMRWEIGLILGFGIMSSVEIRP